MKKKRKLVAGIIIFFIGFGFIEVNAKIGVSLSIGGTILACWWLLDRKEKPSQTATGAKSSFYKKPADPPPQSPSSSTTPYSATTIEPAISQPTDQMIKPTEVASETYPTSTGSYFKKLEAYNNMVASIPKYSVPVSQKKSAKIAASFVNDLTFSTVTKRSNILKLGNFVVVDTETTGLKYTSSEIIDIAAIRFRDFQPVLKFSMLLAPSKPIPKEITTINHITDEMVSGCPCFQEIAESLVEFIGDDDIVGHNLPFDLKFIVHYGADITTKDRKYYDTLAISRKTIRKTKMKWDREFEEYIEDDEFDGVPNYKLETLCDYFSIININTHRAESDALATGLLFHELVKIRTT